MSNHSRNLPVVKGFTLIELVIVIVILGILAAVALPKFLDLSGTARTATLQGVVGALASASSSNYGARIANAALTGTAAVSNCSDVSGLLVGGVPSPYSIVASPFTSGTNGATMTCNVTNQTAGVSQTGTFTAIYVS